MRRGGGENGTREPSLFGKRARMRILRIKQACNCPLNALSLGHPTQIVAPRPSASMRGAEVPQRRVASSAAPSGPARLQIRGA